MTYPESKSVNTKWYNTYHNITNRCYNPNHISYANYGAQGVTMCKEWLDDKQSFAHWYHEQCKQLSINPESNDYQVDKDMLCEQLNITPKVYSPTTCQLISRQENCNLKHNNTTTSKTFIHTDGTEVTTVSLKEFSELKDLSYNALRNVSSGRTKSHKGWSIKEESLRD